MKTLTRPFSHAIHAGLALLAMFVASATSAQTPALPGTAATYRAVEPAVALGAPDRWDYVFYDASGQRVYVAHGDRVTVVDVKSNAVIGAITGMPGGTHGITVIPEMDVGYTDDGEAGEIKAFDLKTLKVTKTIKGQPDADGMILEPVTQHVFVVNGDSGNLSVVDPKRNEVIATIAGGGKLEAAIADGQGLVYVNGAEKGQLLRIDARTNEVTATWPLGDCRSPHGIAMDSKRQRVFVSCVNQKLVVVNAATGQVVAELPIGQGTDAAGFDPVRQRIFSSNGRDGTLTVIEQNGDQYRVLADIPTAITGRTMDVDPQSGRVFLVAGTVDPQGPATGRPHIVPGSLRLLTLVPQP